MYAASFEYHRPTSLSEAISLLSQNPDAKALAGGHSLLPMMKLRLASPSALVDIGRIGGLGEIRRVGDEVEIGALATHATVAASAQVAEACPILAEAAGQIGDTQVRNRGTIGGSIAHADPSADLPTALVALRATFGLVGPSGEREVAAENFFQGLFATDLRDGELLRWMRVRAYEAGTGCAYLKHKHPASGYAVVGVAAIVTVRDRRYTRASVVLGGATPGPTRCVAAEQALVGQPAGAATTSAAADLIREAITDPMADLYASGEYRTHLAGVLAGRALTLATERAAGR